jgi:hypothetical protein
MALALTCKKINKCGEKKGTYYVLLPKVAEKLRDIPKVHLTATLLCHLP